LQACAQTADNGKAEAQTQYCGKRELAQMLCILRIYLSLNDIGARSAAMFKSAMFKYET
jgi:hypothetical protein